MKNLTLISTFLIAASALAEETPPTSPVPGDYPLRTCIVSGEELGSMGDPVKHVVRQEGKPDRTVYLCCKMCIRKLDKAPAKYLEKLDAATPSPTP